MRDVLNNAVRKEHAITDTFREIGARESHDEPLIQLADVLLGATCFYANQKHTEPGASACKVELAEYIAVSAGFDPQRGIGETAAAARKFNVWRWSPRFHGNVSADFSVL
jgi:hypothetical protein